MKILVLFYSTYGHTYEMAKAEAEGAQSVPETLSPEILEKMHASESQKIFEHIPVARVQDLADADAIIFGTPTRFGNMAAQMKTFLDATGQLWANHSLVGKVGAVFTSTNTQHGGQETTILSFMITLLHHGMIIAGLPYTFDGQTTMAEIAGGSPYGASTIAGGNEPRMPSQTELDGARYQGRYVAEITAKLKS